MFFTTATIQISSSQLLFTQLRPIYQSFLILDFVTHLLFNIPEFNSLTSVDMALVTLSAATSKSFLRDRPKLLLALLEPLPGKLFVLNADLTSKISIFLARSNFQIKKIFLNRNCSMQLLLHKHRSTYKFFYTFDSL